MLHVRMQCSLNTTTVQKKAGSLASCFFAAGAALDQAEQDSAVGRCAACAGGADGKQEEDPQEGSAE